MPLIRFAENNSLGSDASLGRVRLEIAAREQFQCKLAAALSHARQGHVDLMLTSGPCRPHIYFRGMLTSC